MGADAMSTEETSPYDRATILIESAQLMPTEHLLLKAFLDGAVDPELAAGYVLQEASHHPARAIEDALRDFKQEWRRLVHNFSFTFLYY